MEIIRHNPKTFLVQKDKYSKRAENFLLMGGTACVAVMGAIAAMPMLGALAVPTIGVTTALAGASVVGFGANKIAEKITDTYEPLTKREKIANFISDFRAKSLDVRQAEVNKLKQS